MKAKKKDIQNNIQVSQVQPEPKKQYANPRNLAKTIISILIGAIVFFLSTNYSTKLIDPILALRFRDLSFISIGFVLVAAVAKLKIPNISNSKLTAIFFYGMIGFALWSLVGYFRAINIADFLYGFSFYMLFFMLLILFFILVVQEMIDLSLLSKLLSFVLLFHSYVALDQYYELGKFADIPGSNAVPYGFMGNRNLLGSYLALLVPFLFIAIATAKEYAKAIYIFIGIIAIYAIAIAQTRAAWLATISMLVFIAFAAIIYFNEERRKVLKLISMAMVSICFLVFLIFKFGLTEETKATVNERVESLTLKSTNGQADYSANDRLNIWRKTKLVIDDNLGFGVGLNNWKINVMRYGTKGTAWAGERYSPDHVHNTYLQMMAETGLLGFLLYVLAFILAGMMTHRLLISKNCTKAEKIFVIGLAAGVVVFLVDSMFSFAETRVDHKLLLAVYLAAIAGLFFKNNQFDKEKMFFKSSWSFYISFLIVVACCAYMAVNKLDFVRVFGNVYGTKGKQSIEFGKQYTGKFDFTTDEGRTISSITSVAHGSIGSYDIAIQESLQALKSNPTLGLAYNNLSSFYYSLKKYDSAKYYNQLCLNLKPDYQPSLIGRFYLHYALKEYDSCKMIYPKLAKQDDSIIVKIMSQINNPMP